MEQKRIKVRLTKNSPYSEYGYYDKGDIGYIDGYTEDNAVIILENGKFAKADLRWIEVVNEEDNNVNTVLTESDDDRIRKRLAEYFWGFYDRFATDRNHVNVHWEGLEVRKVLAWLEKQGEHANFRNKIQIGDKVTRNEDGVLVNLSQLNRVAKKDEKQGEPKEHDVCDNCEQQGSCVSSCCVKLVEKNGEQKPTNKVEPKFKVGDKVKKGYLTYTVEDIGEDSYKLQAYSKNGDKGCTVFLTIGYEKDFELVEQKPVEWSEEDESHIRYLIECLEHCKKGVALTMTTSTAQEYISWLKSLRPQNTWKPSEEQMIALKCAITTADEKWVCMNTKDLESLYEDLKKLREE